MDGNAVTPGREGLWSNHPMVPPLVILATVITTGIISAIGAGILPSLELSGGVEKRRGTLHINGDVDIPEVHRENIKQVAIPVHISEGDGINWAILAKVFTPGKKDLIKTFVTPMGSTGAEIKLHLAEDFDSKVSGNITVYLEVAAVGLDIHGERNLLEKMVEINISQDAIE